MKQIEEMRIRPGQNGGHSITHEFKREVSSKKLGDMGYSRPNSEDFNFGPGQDSEVLAHISEHLGLKGAPAPEKE